MNTKKECMKHYLTTYALTKGIIEVELDCEQEGLGFYCLDKNPSLQQSGCIGIDLFESYQEACVNAEERKIKAINSLKSRIEKLENKHFGFSKTRQIDPNQTIFYHQYGG